jgi:hypothetical protein
MFIRYLPKADSYCFEGDSESRPFNLFLYIYFNESLVEIWRISLKCFDRGTTHRPQLLFWTFLSSEIITTVKFPNFVLLLPSGRKIRK